MSENDKLFPKCGIEYEKINLFALGPEWKRLTFSQKTASDYKHLHNEQILLNSWPMRGRK